MTIRLRRILLPTDFSSFSSTATQYACELAAKFDAELHLDPPVGPAGKAPAG